MPVEAEADAFSVPSSYQRMLTSPSKLAFFARVGVRIQATRRACSDQNASGSAMAASVMARCCSAVTWAWAAISGKTG